MNNNTQHTHSLNTAYVTHMCVVFLYGRFYTEMRGIYGYGFFPT